MKKKHINKMTTFRNVLKSPLRTFFFLVCVGSFIPEISNAQFMDTIRIAMKKKPSIFGTLDTRNTFIGSRRAEISGIKGGVRFTKFRIGVGYHFLATPRYKDFDVNSPEYSGASSVKQEIRYLSLFTDYIFHKSRKWEYNVAVQIGVGRQYYGPEQYTGELYNKHSFVLYEPTISAEYSIFRWLGISGKYGYRLGIGGENLTAPIYAFGLDVYWGTIYRNTVRRIKQWREERR